MIRPRLSIHNKIFSSYLLLTIIISILTLFIGTNILNNNYISNLTEQLKTQSNQIESIILSQKEDVIQELQNLSEVLSKRITIIDQQGIVMFDSYADEEALDNHLLRPEIQQSIHSEFGSSIRFSDSIGCNMLYVARRIDNPLGQFLRLSMPLRNLDVIKRDFQIGILQTLSIVFIIILILSYVLSGKFSRPLKSLSHAAEQVTKGDLNVKVHILTGDELESVGNSFNKMIGQVKENLYSIEQQKAELSEIISSLSEVLWVIDKTGNIVISNPGFSKTFHLAGKTEEAYWHLIKDAEVLELIGETLSTKQNIIKTVSINDKDFILSSSYLDRYERAIFIMQNVSELKQVQRMKQDFIVNMAHELRTPITAIKGFAEMLESSVPEDKKRFLTIIRNHSDRLANLVEDIQMLINLEQIGKLDIEHIHLRKFAENIRQLYEARFNELGINFQLEIDDSITNFYGDIFKLDQIFINLIDNALRYTSEGYIKLSIERKNNFIGFKVTDTGCGIENKHLDRLFERFYVADKARSRKMGGTGLGLAIVKHIVMLHHGTVSVESEVGKGTCFTINLPLDLNEN